MPFNPDSGYYNRYKKSKNFFEWRNIAGEVPQAAELNEIQSLTKDLLQRTGDSFLQNGDVISGMFLTRLNSGTKSFGNETLDVVLYETAGPGKIWIDGAVHEISDQVKNLAVPKVKNNTPLWGFLGVYLRKEVIKAAADATLYDPAVSDINGTAFGLPGANRLKITPIWVAGTLSVSDFDDKKISTLAGVTNDPSTAAGLTFEVDTTESISPNCVYNAKVVIPQAVSGATLLRVYFKQTNAITPDSKIKFSIKVSNPGSDNTVSVRPQLFIGNQPLVPNASNPVTTLTDGTSANIELTITQAILNNLNTASTTQFSIGLELTSLNPISTDAEIYLSDLHLLYKNQERKPKYKQFSTLSGSVYNSFIVGPSTYITHGEVGSTSNTAQPTILNNTLLSTVTIPVEANNPNIDYIIRDTNLTEDTENIFIAEYGVSKEDALVRVYPVHITYNGEIVSSLPNREYTKLTDSFLSERLSNVVTSSVVEGLEVSGLTVNGVLQTHTVQVSPGNAFVNGRLFMGISPEAGVDVNKNQISKTVTIVPESSAAVTLTTPEIITFVGANQSYKLNAGVFESIDAASVEVLFRENITYNSSAVVYGESVHTREDIPLSNLDSLTVPNVVNIVKISDNTRTYERGLDWDIVFRTEIVNNKVVKRGVVGWHYYQAQYDGNTLVRRASLRPSGQFTVLYTASIDLTLPPTANSQITYDSDGTFNTGFKLSTTTPENTDVKLSGFTNSSPSTLFGPYLLFVQGDFSFKSSIIVYKYTAKQVAKYIVYFSGNVAEDGPDGALGYQLIGDISPDGESAALIALQNNNKLPLAQVTVPITDINQHIKQYRFKLTNVVEQQQINDQISDLLKVLPALVTQNVLSGDVSSTITYANAPLSSAEPTRLDTLTWVVDGNVFPALKDYTVEVKYSYFGDNLTNTYQAQGFINNELLDSIGALRGMIATIKDSAGNARKKILVVFSYDINNISLNPVVKDVETYLI